MLTAPTIAQIESIVHGRIRAALAERVGEVGDLSATDKLNATLGLTSLDLAFLVADLEAELGVDPFAKLVSITSVRSVGDLVQAYQQAFFPGLKRSAEDDAIAAAVERGRARRARRERRSGQPIAPRAWRSSASRAVFRAPPITARFGKTSAKAWNRSAR